MAEILGKYNQLEKAFEECSLKKKMGINSDDSDKRTYTRQNISIDKSPTKILTRCVNSIKEIIANHELLSNLKLGLADSSLNSKANKESNHEFQNSHSQKIHSFQTPNQKPILSGASNDDETHLSLPSPKSLQPNHFLNFQANTVDIENFKMFSSALEKTNPIKKYVYSDPFSTPQGVEMLNINDFHIKKVHNTPRDFNNNKFELSTIKPKRTPKLISNQVTPTPLRFNTPKEDFMPAPEWRISDDNSIDSEVTQSPDELPEGLWEDDESTRSDEGSSYEPRSSTSLSKSQSLSPNPDQNSDISEEVNAETSIFHLRRYKEHGDLKDKRLKLIKTNRRDKIEVANMKMIEDDRKKKEMDRRSDREERLVNERVSFSHKPTSVVPITPRNKGRKVPDRSKTKRKKLKLQFNK